MAFQKKLLIAFIALVFAGGLIYAISPNLFSETADDAGVSLAMLGGVILSAIGGLGILVCALIWKGPGTP